MKKNVIILLSVCFSTFIKAQTIPNAGFENWETINSWEDPTNWASTNIGNSIGIGTNVYKSTDAHTGNFSLKLNQNLIPQADTSIHVFSIGQVSIGEMFKFLDQSIIGFEDIEPALICNNRPDSLICWFKFAPGLNATNNAFGIKAILTKFNTSTSQNDTIGTIDYAGTTVNDFYSRLSLPIEYSSSLIPDKINIRIEASYFPDPINGLPVASDFFPAEGAYLLIDDISFVSQSLNSIEENNTLNVEIYPNPVNDVLNINNLIENEYQIITLEGKVIEVLKTNGSQEIQLSSSTFENGIYLIQTKTGVNVGRFIISH
jgi:hypothetical protein